MTTKDYVLSFLSDRSGEYVSGEILSEKCSVTRMAIKKAVDSLKRDGYEIESRKHHGYILRERGDVLNKKEIEKEIADSGISVVFFDTTFSTNKDAKSLVLEGVNTPFVVVANKQEGGRGRLGRKFDSPSGGIYFSLVLSGSNLISPDLITVASATAISEKMEELTGIETSIKWVNDIYIKNKKAVGILCEGIVNLEEKRLDKVIIGVGINYKTKEEDFSPEIRDIATSFFPTGQAKVTRARCIAECCKRIIEIQKEDFIDKYREKCFVIGKEIAVIRGDERRNAFATGLDEAGHLVVRYENGEEEALSSGEISIRLNC